MSALDLDALEARCKDTIAEWTLVYAQSGETLPDDAVETKAARETLALITRLRAAEARTAWQPIETVAVDETVLLWDPVRRGVRMGHVSIRRGCIYTHWMTLPAAPEAPHG